LTFQANRVMIHHEMESLWLMGLLTGFIGF
jgi:hypothetical protein